MKCSNYSKNPRHGDFFLCKECATAFVYDPASFVKAKQDKPTPNIRGPKHSGTAASYSVEVDGSVARLVAKAS
jgi:hypothetical protein